MQTKGYTQIFFLLGICFLFFLSSCSTRKNNFFSRSYHNTTTHYNWYFNANESFKSGVKKFEENQKTDFNKPLPIFQLPSKDNNEGASFGMDKAIKKSANAITKHSMLIRGEEHNNWVDDCYLLIGKSYLYKLEYIKAIEAFGLVSRQFEGSESSYEALIWQAKTYVQSQDYSSAELIFENLFSDEEFPEKLNQELSLVYADYFVKKGNYSEAIVELKDAISLTRKKQYKIRYLFIVAQLYQQLDNYEEATNYFLKVLSKNPKYEIAFNAKINLARSFDTSSGGTEKLRQQLKKMLKDRKNKEYLDVIYFGLAELSIREEKKAEAITYYKKSVSSSMRNDPQKSLSSLKLGQIFYNDQSYILAQAYYDTAVVFMEKSHEEYNRSSARQRTLNDLVINLNIISTQDSLQMVASLPENERIALIDELINQIKEEEALQKRLQAEAKNESAFLNDSRGGASNRLNQGQKIGGTWYFYNPTTLSFGFSEFSRKWGRRKLEDNWRRANKSSISDIADSGDTATEEVFDPQSRDSYLQALPTSVSEIRRSNTLIMDAYYSASVIYKEGLEDNPKSIEMLEQLNQRFPKNDNQVRVLYFLYRLNLEENDAAKAQKYKEELLQLFPNSEYAKLINDPSYQEKILSSKSTVDILYEEAHQQYIGSNFTSTSQICQQSLADHPGNLLAPRFEFLDAMARGHYQEQETFKALLEKVIENYPEHEVADYAKDILAQMKPEENDSSDENVTEKVEDGVEYVKKMTDPHYFVILFKDYDLDVSFAKKTISNYHAEFYSLVRLNTSNLLLDTETHMISVRQFTNADEGMKYYNAFLTAEARVPFGQEHEAFIISASNFPLFFKNKDVEGYLKHFKVSYLD
jgi:tetratricopeptide (TPR) repeat protein